MRMNTDNSMTPIGRRNGRIDIHFLWALAFTLLALVAIGLVGYGSFTIQEYLARKAAQDQLALVSGLKVKQIQAWIDHEKSTALGLSRGMLMSAALEDWLAGGSVSNADKIRILESLKGMQGIFGYRDVGLLTINGEPLLSSTGLQEKVERYDKWVLVDALLTGRPQLTSVRWDQDATRSVVHLDVLAPILARLHGKEQVIALLRLRVDPVGNLFPLVQDWPIPTETAETLLTGIQGADVVFLSELRHRKGLALRLTVPMNHPDMLAAQVARGAVDVPLEGLDYMGHKVMGMGRAIPGTQWFVIAKQDQGEVFKDLWPRTLLTSLIALGFVTVAYLSVRFWMKQREGTQIQMELENQANTDRLTGLANRRLFDTHISRELRRLRRHLRGNDKAGLLAVAIIDVDHFKLYNDTYGHMAGDHCLKAIAEALQSCITRPADLACRFGGEEFILVLPDTDEAGAMIVAETARIRVEKMALPHTASPVAKVITVSVGAAASEIGENFLIESLIETADKALYEAKGTGRNRVVGSKSLL
jgi:diguanylate cyclase (GGDEF)-like protein